MRDGQPLRRQGADALPHDPARPVPPEHMPLLRGGRPRKVWRYVGAYGPEFLLCAGSVRIGPLGQSFLAVWDRRRRTLVESVSVRPGAVDLSTGMVRARARRVSLDLRTDEATGGAGEPVEVRSPHGAQYIWTRKRPVTVHGTVTIDGVPRAVRAPGLIDDSAGYHARVTDWEWSAGAGTDQAGRAVVWNLVRGVHDDPRASEQTVWIDGRAQQPGPPRFLPHLAGCAFAEGGELRCDAEAERAHHERRVLISSRYRQPFGTFTGVLPAAGALAEAYGVMEEHRARW